MLEGFPMISPRLNSLLCRELGLQGFPFEDGTVATTVPGWDSLRHVAILTAVEKEYGVRFKPLEIIRLKCVGDLQQLIDRKAGTA
jgi:acyl carrier protein